MQLERARVVARVALRQVPSAWPATRADGLAAAAVEKS
jgi:hypothetical protein